MKRETMKWASDAIAELKRLWRIERAAKKAVSMQTAEGLDLALDELASAVKGGRK